MAKKKKKRQKRLKKHIAANQQHLHLLENDINDLIKILHETLTPSRSRKAISTAKLLIKHPDFNDSLIPEVVKSYRFRVEELLAKGKIESIGQVVKSFDSHNFNVELLSSELKVKVSFATPELLNEFFQSYNHDQQNRDAINLFIANELTNLTLIAENKFIPDANIIKEQASLLLTAWQEVESSTGAGENFTVMLKVIKRRSPFIAWRLFIVGLDYFYSKQPKMAVQCFAKIDQSSPLYKTANALKAIASETDNNVDDKAVKLIEGKIFNSELMAALRRLDTLYAAKHINWSILQSQLSKLTKRTDYHEKPTLYTAIFMLIVDKLDYDFLNNHYVFNYLDKIGVNSAHLIALLNQGDADDWGEYIDSMVANKFHLEKALAWDHVALLKAQEIDEEEDDDDRLIFGFLFNFNENKSKAEKANEFHVNAEICWEKSVYYYPLSETYEKWYECAEKYLKATKSDKVLEAWHKAFPEADKALLKLTISCRKRKVYSKAEKYLLRFEELNCSAPGLALLKQRIYLDMGVKFVANQQFKQLTNILDKLPPSEDIVCNLFQLILNLSNCFATCKQSKKTAIKSLLEEIKNLGHPLLCELITSAFIKHSRMPEEYYQYINEPIELNSYIHSLYRLLMIDDNYWSEALNAKLSFPKQLDANAITVESKILITCYNRLGKVLQMHIVAGSSEFAWAIAQTGLRRNDQYLAHFLSIRAESIAFELKALDHLDTIDFIATRLEKVLLAMTKYANDSHDNLLIHEIRVLVENICKAGAREGFEFDIKYAKPLTVKQYQAILNKEQKATLAAIHKKKSSGYRSRKRNFDQIIRELQRQTLDDFDPF